MRLLTCQNVALGYEGKPIVEGVNFSVDAGDYLCIVGENGSGKSTLMKTILNLKPPLKGSILTGGGLRQTEIGYLPQQTVVQKDFPGSVKEIVLSGCLNRCGMRPFYNKAEKLLAYENMQRMGIECLARRCYRELSGGQQQRVLLARALCAARKMLLLDEPVAGLDPNAVTDMYELIARLNREDELTIVMISHDVAAAVHFASHILHLGCEPPFFGSADEYRKNGAGLFPPVPEEKAMAELLQKLALYFEHPFVRYALIVGVLIALCSSLLGVILVLKRLSFIGDGLSHVAFGAMSAATVVSLTNDMLLVLPVTVVCAVLLLRSGQNARINGDAAVAMISVGALAIGYLLVNLFSTSANLTGDVCSTLFGSISILTLTQAEVWLSIGMSILVIGVYLLFYNKIFSVTFDESFATATGIRTKRYNLVIAVTIAVIIVLAMNLVGSLLISALVIFPALSAMRLYKSFRSVIICSAIVSVICAVVGMLVSILAGTPVGSTIVAIDILLFGAFWLIGSVKEGIER